VDADLPLANDSRDLGDDRQQVFGLDLLMGMVLEVAHLRAKL
jgi:hypothetical protein